MRLLAAARLAASGICAKAATAHALAHLMQRRRQRDHGFDRVAVGIGDQLVAVAFVNEGAHLGQRVGGDLAGREGASGQVEQIVQRQRAVLVDLQPAAGDQLLEGADQAQRARRRPKGSRSPVGARPMAQMPTRVSARSAMNSVAAVSVSALTGASQRLRYWVRSASTTLAGSPSPAA